MKKDKYFAVYPALTYNSDPKYEYSIYNNPRNDNDRHQFRFDIVFESIEEFFEGLAYMTSEGWFEKMKLEYGISSHYHSWAFARKTRITAERGRGEKEEDYDLNATLMICVVVDLKRIEDFRNLLKNFKGYKTYWLTQVGNKVIDYKYIIK